MGALQEEAEEAEALRSQRTVLVEEAGAEGEAAEAGELPQELMTVHSTLRRDGKQKSRGSQLLFYLLTSATISGYVLTYMCRSPGAAVAAEVAAVERARLLLLPRGVD